MTRLKIKSIVVFFAFFIGACLPTAAQQENKKNRKVTVGDFLHTVIITGSLQARKAEHFTVPQTREWRIQLKWMAPEGRHVKPGDPVARFETANLASEIENIELGLQDKLEQKKQKIAELAHQKLEMELQLKKAEIEFKKKELDAAVPKGVESRQTYDQKQLEMKRAAEDLKKARMEKKVKLTNLESAAKRMDIRIEQDQVKLEDSLKTLKSLTLKAKTAGNVIHAKHRWEDRKVQVGETVFATSEVASIPDVNSLRVEAWVNESHINHLKIGQRADIILDAYPGKRFSGTVKDVLNSAEKRRNWGKTHYFSAIIGLDSHDPEIMKPGMSVKCIVHAADLPNVLLAPIEMSRFDGRSFWLKPRGQDAVKITPAGFNQFHLALTPGSNGKIKEGTLLEPVPPSQIKEIKGKNSENI
ncbi:MAG: HlyD family efflux transporter periplasmic adaptor subunit [bacterium]|nr:HlyD family efflux transporter periplasmic adaptor subunit [bacterium]